MRNDASQRTRTGAVRIVDDYGSGMPVAENMLAVKSVSSRSLTITPSMFLCACILSSAC